MACHFGRHQAAFEKVVIADTNQQSAEDRARLRTLAQIVFQALQKHEERCLVCGANGMPDLKLSLCSTLLRHT